MPETSRSHQSDTYERVFFSVTYDKPAAAAAICRRAALVAATAKNTTLLLKKCRSQLQSNQDHRSVLTTIFLSQDKWNSGLLWHSVRCGEGELKNPTMENSSIFGFEASGT